MAIIVRVCGGKIKMESPTREKIKVAIGKGCFNVGQFQTVGGICIWAILDEGSSRRRIMDEPYNEFTYDMCGGGGRFYGDVVILDRGEVVV